MLKFRFAFALIGCFGIGALLRGDEASEAKLVRSIVTAQNLWHHDEAVTRLLAAIPPHNLPALKQHKHHTIAFAAAWNDVRANFPKATDVDAIDQMGARIDRKALDRFVGFIEGRLHVNVPKVWNKSLLTTRVQSEGHLFNLEFAKSWPDQTTDAGQSAPLSVFANKEDNRLRVSTGGGSCLLPEEIDNQEHSVCALIHKKNCFVAFYEEVGFGYPVYCVDVETEKVKWKSNVLGGWYGGASGAGHMHRVAMRVENDQLIIFGACLTSSYVEAFSSISGKPVCRFTTLQGNAPLTKP